MAEQDTEPGGIRFLASGDESGTAPGDRPFRPDVEGLRAVAIILVVLFHSGVSALSGGYVGVDVFFVISGFVITGVLLRERAVSGRTSLLAFYGRRCRRIIPAATVVIIVTVVLAYLFLGVGVGGRTAIDGRWATVFLANVHFNAIGVDYLSPRLPPSPLQNFWSLSVEEQFYVVYPTLFLLLAGIRSRWSLRLRLAVGLAVVTGASLAFSVFDTHSDAVGAYFSPFSRAWELGLGALVAVGTPWLKRLPVGVAAAATWIGLGAILAAACTFGAQTAYPGSAVAIPVFGAAFIIAGGVVAPRLGVEVLLRLPPFARHRETVLLPVFVALADPCHRGGLRGQDHAVGGGESRLGRSGPGRLGALLSTGGEPHPTRPSAASGPLGQRRHGSRSGGAGPGRHRRADHHCGCIGESLDNGVTDDGADSVSSGHVALGGRLRPDSDRSLKPRPPAFRSDDG